MYEALAAVLFASPSWGSSESSGKPKDASVPPRRRASHKEEKAWIVRIQLGDEATFEVLFRTYFDALVRYAASYIHDDLSARELVSDIFSTLWDKRATWSPQAGVAAYLYGAVRNRALNYERSRRRYTIWSERAAREPDPPGVGIPNDFEHDEHYVVILHKVQEAIEALPPARREAMALRWDHQMSPEQIAQVMGISRSAVYHLLERSLTTLRQLLNNELG